MSKSPMLPSIKSLLNMPSEMDGHHSQHSRKQYHSGTSSSSTRTHHHHYNPDRRPKPYDSHRHTEIPKLPSVNEVLASAQRPTPDPFLSYNYKRESGSSSRDIRSSGESSKKSGYPCERCGRLFTRKSDALKHIRVVHDRLKVYACCVCDRRFARKDYCTKHEKSLHNIVAPPTPYQLRRKLAKERAENAFATQR